MEYTDLMDSGGKDDEFERKFEKEDAIEKVTEEDDY
jgi:hypothetical protein